MCFSGPFERPSGFLPMFSSKQCSVSILQSTSLNIALIISLEITPRSRLPKSKHGQTVFHLVIGDLSGKTTLSHFILLFSQPPPDECPILFLLSFLLASLLSGFQDSNPASIRHPQFRKLSDLMLPFSPLKWDLSHPVCFSFLCSYIFIQQTFLWDLELKASQDSAIIPVSVLTFSDTQFKHRPFPTWAFWATICKATPECLEIRNIYLEIPSHPWLRMRTQPSFWENTGREEGTSYKKFYLG